MYNELNLGEIAGATRRSCAAAHAMARLTGPADWLAHEAAWAHAAAVRSSAQIEAAVGFLRHPVVHNPGAGHPSYGRGQICTRADGSEYSVNWDR